MKFTMHKLVYGLVGLLLLGIFGFLIVPKFKSSPPPQVEVSHPATSNELGNDKTAPTNKDQSISQVVTDPIDSVLVGKKLANNYFEFKQQDYLELKKLGRPILLYFYANWCPTCAVQEPLLNSFMNSGKSNGKVALRVNYNDSDTEATEKELAKTFTITYQHSFIAVGSDGRQVDQAIGMQTEENLRDLFSKI